MKRKLKNKRNLQKKTAQNTEDRRIDFTLVGRALGKMLIKKGMSLLGWNSTQETEASNQTENENHSDVPPDPHPQPDDQPIAMEEEHYFNHEVDVNINAIDNERPQKSRASASKKTQTRRIKKTGALDARSCSNVKKTRKKKAEEKRGSSSLEGSKRAKLKLLKKRLVKLQNDVQEISKSLDDDLVGSLSCSAQNISSRTRSSVDLESQQKDSLTTVDAASKSTTDRASERFRKRQKQRTQRKTVDLINNYEAGPSHVGQLEIKKHQHKTVQKVKTEGRLPKTKTASSTLSPRLPALAGPKDSEDWPSLPGTDRPKCQMKEAAKEMIKNKQSGSLTKICRKRWSDVVLRRSEESGLSNKNESVDNAKRTWASVASHGTNRSSETSIEVSSQSVAASNKRKKTHSPVETEHHVELRDREDTNTALSVCSADAVTKKTKKSSRQSKEEMDQTKRKGRVVEKDLSAVLSSANSCEANQCCIDEMPVVYTKPVGACISLNEGKSKKDKNKCNNRTATLKTVKQKADRSVPSKESSDLDICDRLSTFSFESTSEKSEGTCKSLRKTKPRGTDVSAQKTRHRKIGAASCQKDNHKPNQEEVDRSKQKKISTKYRALMRGESGRLDAKAITEVTTRARRNEALQGDKELNRSLLKKQRQQRQQTSYNLQRSPPKKAKELDLSPEVNNVSSPAKNPPENRDNPSTSKQRKCNPNKSDKKHSSAAPDVFRQKMRADAHKPVYAESAPDLNRQPKRFIVEFEPANCDALDMVWWHAYFMQQPPAPDSTEDDFDQVLHRNK